MPGNLHEGTATERPHNCLRQGRLFGLTVVAVLSVTVFIGVPISKLPLLVEDTTLCSMEYRRTMYSSARSVCWASSPDHVCTSSLRPQGEKIRVFQKDKMWERVGEVHTFRRLLAHVLIVHHLFSPLHCLQCHTIPEYALPLQTFPLVCLLPYCQ